MQKTHWSPTPKQAQALVRTEFEILYGGARAGGKTDAGQAWLTYDIDNTRLRALVIRRNADDLKDWSARAQTMYAPLGVKTRGNPREFIFPSGATIVTGHLKDENAFEKYQGHEYQRMLVEELNHITSEESYMKLLSSCRSTVDGLKAQMFCTTNPGGAGHLWVKKRWNIPDRPEEIIESVDPKSGRTRVFIQATVEDNPHIMEKDPDYVLYLESLPEGLKEQWRYGYWEDVEVKGAYYAKLINESKNRITHVPYDKALKVNTYWDLGVNDTTAIWFMQIYGKEVRIIDCYENSGEGLPHYLEVLKDKPYDYGTHYYPHDLKVRELSSGKSREDRIKEYGINNYEIVDKIGIDDGIEQVRALLPYCWFDKEKCQLGLEALKNYRKKWDENRQTYLKQPLHDWASNYADAFRYLAVANKFEEKQRMKLKPRRTAVNRITGEKARVRRF